MVKSIYIFVFLVIALSCKKEKDTVTHHDIKGMVYNNCTDSGLANVTVFLQDGQGLNLSTVSGVNGSFSFGSIQVHSNSKYNYVLYIPSKSGTNATTFEYCGFDGTRLYFNHDEADVFFKPRVTPRYLSLNLFCNKSPITGANDSIMFFFTNNTFHKNVPDYPYKFGGGGFYGTTSYNIGNIGNYPMGKYVVNIDKWVSGIHTSLKDSIYLAWGANTTYTINW